MAHRASSINNSSSKHTYVFSKADRFGPNKQYNNVSCYEVKSQFKTLSSSASGFGSASKRFGNLGVGKSDIRNWAPHGDSYYKTNFTGSMGKLHANDQRDIKNRT